MTWNEYWYGDVWMVEMFIKADKERQKRQNHDAWLQGMYFWDAISTGLSNFSIQSGFAKGQKIDYPKEPYQIFKEEDADTELTEQEREEQEEQERLRAKLYMQQMVWVGRNWGKGA